MASADHLPESDNGLLPAPRVDRDAFVADSDLHSELEASLRRLERYAERSKADATHRAYRADWDHFARWCARYGRSAMPAEPETVGLYLGAIVEQFTLATIERRMAAINTLHREAGYEVPASVGRDPLRQIWQGIVREKTRRRDKAEPLLVEELRRIVQSLPRDWSGALTLASLRDRALLLLGWAGALRRSELVGLQVSDLEFVAGSGFNLYIRYSKTDQEGEGLVKGIPYGAHPETCPVVSLRVWLQAAGITSGPLFRRLHRGGTVGAHALTPQYVSIILKKHARTIGLDVDEFSAHSLRSGFITQAIRSGKPERRVKEHSGHRSWETFNGYVKHAATFQGNPAQDLGL